MMRAAMLGFALLALSGCAKEATLAKTERPALGGSLEGGPWLFEDVNGAGVPAGVRADITFEPGDHNTSVVFGSGGCNRFRGGWEQKGSAIKLGPLAGTMMMCEPAKMETERKVQQALEAARTVSFDATGAAFLKAPDGGVVKLRREKK
ncbi:MAG: META domain-containing protein [Sandarakinorhabdus sp.]|nr:META domain-containing protein [Sandarakinorhabdus sp.]